ncbi:hypothetical protein TNCV_4442841 [Trichonephila clavipes]|nr:hypothetical protein TNCV_4442841 [Trichonephila clavipes]
MSNEVTINLILVEVAIHWSAMETRGTRKGERKVTRKERVEEKSSEKTRAGRLRKRRGESQGVLFRDADQESKRG